MGSKSEHKGLQCVEPLMFLASKPTLRRTSALVTEWSQNWGHAAKLSCHPGFAPRPSERKWTKLKGSLFLQSAFSPLLKVRSVYEDEPRPKTGGLCMHNGVFCIAEMQAGI